MNCSKYSIALILIGILAGIHAFIGYSILTENHRAVLECSKIWPYSVGFSVISGVTVLVCLLSTIFCMLLSENRKKYIIILYLVSLIAPILWGIYLEVQMPGDCAEMYQNDYPDLYSYYQGTFWYAVSIWIIFACWNIYMCIKKMTNNTSTSQQLADEQV